MEVEVVGCSRAPFFFWADGGRGNTDVLVGGFYRNIKTSSSIQPQHTCVGMWKVNVHKERSVLLQEQSATVFSLLLLSLLHRWFLSFAELESNKVHWSTIVRYFT